MYACFCIPRHTLVTVLSFCTELVAVVTINQAIDQQDALKTVKALSNPSANLENVFSDLVEDYQSALFLVKSHKVTKSQAQVYYRYSDI